MVLIRDDARGGEGFGLPLAADAPFLPFGPLGLPLAADAPCWAAPPFFVLRVMMVLWCVRVLDSKKKLLRFVQPFFAMENVRTGTNRQKTLCAALSTILKPRHPDQKLYCRLFVPPVLHRKMRLSIQQAVTSRA
jgi:hypothetical protein